MGTKLFVGNLSFDASEQDLRDLFTADGREVVNVSIISDRDSGRSRGFGFVEMASDADAQAAMAAHDGQDLNGRDLRVNTAHEKPQRDSNRGGRF